MINNLPESFQFSSALFADDQWFWKVGNNIKELNKMAQNSLNKIEGWCNENGIIIISNSKSTAILFTKKRKNKEITLTFNARNIESSKQTKYLGVIFQENGLFNAHIKSIQVKCLKRRNVVRYLKGSKWGMSKDPLLSLYRALIHQIIEYDMKIYFDSADGLIQLVEKYKTIV